jgi:hypothetical protein
MKRCLCVYVCSGNIATLYGFKEQPVPFFYVHLLFLISSIYLPLFAYSLATKTAIPQSCDAVAGMCWIGLYSWELAGLTMIFVQNIVSESDCFRTTMH